MDLHHGGPDDPTLPDVAGAEDRLDDGALRLLAILGLGVVDVTPGTLDTAAQIEARVERALERVDAGRITLNPDCGFAPGSAATVDVDEVYRKLCAEAQAARSLRARHA